MPDRDSSMGALPRKNKPISETHPDLVKEFDLQKNHPLTPKMITFGSVKKIHWICNECENQWIATPNNRSSGKGCPVCAGQAVHSDGRNSMRATHPKLVSEFDLDANNPTTPDNVKARTSKKLHWICTNCSHKWVARGYSRARGSSCPACANKAVHIDGRNSMRSTHPELSKEFDMAYNKPMTPESLVACTNKILGWICRNCSHKWSTSGNHRVSQNSGCPACSGNAVHLDGRNSLSVLYPKLAKEFDYLENGKLTPEEIIGGSNKRIGWICSTCDHKWRTQVANRSIRGYGCPACANTHVHIDGRNSLAKTHPELSKEFDLERNSPITPLNILAGSNKSVYWICSSCQNEWKAVVGSRAINSRGCPACAGRLHSDGRNSLGALDQQLASELHPTKNGKWNKDNLVISSHKRIWWVCKTKSERPCGGVWQTTVAHRKYTGCPACAKFGFDPNKPAQYYVIRIQNKTEDTIYFKAGKSNHYKRRFKEHIRKFKNHNKSKDWTLKIEEIYEEDSGSYIQKIETQLLRQTDIRAPNIEGLSDELFITNPLEYARTTGLV